LACAAALCAISASAAYADTPTPPVRAKAAFDADAKTTDWLPIDLNAPLQIYFPVTLNGVRINALLDSGAGVTTISHLVAGDLGLRSEGGLVVAGAAGDVAAAVSRDATIKVDNLSIPVPHMAVVDLGQVAASSRRPIHLVLGREAFEDVIVDIDAPGRRIAFRDPADFKAPPGALELPLFRANGLRTTVVSLEGRPPVQLLVDLGLAGGIELTRKGAERAGLSDGRPTSHVSGGVALGGSYESDRTSIHAVRLAGYALNEVPIDVRDSPTTQRYAVDGVLGLGLLSRFRMVFDYPHDKLFLVPVGDSARPFQKDNLGMLVIASPRGFTVWNVVGSGPAEAAGLRKGDRIQSLNDLPVDRAGLEALTQAGPGVQFRIGLEDGSTKTVTTGAYY
jgi:predicted aspartyl protease